MSNYARRRRVTAVIEAIRRDLRDQKLKRADNAVARDALPIGSALVQCRCCPVTDYFCLQPV